MDSDADKREPKQTTPSGVEIPVPTRDAFLRDLTKVAPPPKPAKPDDDGTSS
jgi:hypothetical protein